MGRTENSHRLLYDEGMPIDRASLLTLRKLIAKTPTPPERSPTFLRIARPIAAIALKAALALADDISKQQRTTAAAVLGRKGGSATSRRLGADHYHKMAAAMCVRQAALAALIT